MKYIHLRRYNGTQRLATGGVTIAFTNIQQGESTVHLASFAVCSEKDNYCKKTGRDEALNRYIEGQYITCKVIPEIPIVTQILDTFEEHLSVKFHRLNKADFKILKKALQ